MTEQNVTLDTLKKLTDIHVPHIGTTVNYIECGADGPTQDEIKAAVVSSLKKSRKAIKDWSKDNAGSSGDTQTNVTKVQLMIEKLGDEIDEDDAERMLAQAREQDAASQDFVRKPPLYTWLHWEKDKKLPGSGPKRWSMLAKLPVLPAVQGELDDLQKVPLYPMIDDDKKPYYGFFLTSYNPYYLAKLQNNKEGWTCSTLRYTTRTKTRLAAGTPVSKISALHGDTVDITNFCAKCKYAPHNTDKDSDTRCRKSRMFVVYLLAQVGDCRSEDKTNLKPAIVGPLLMELSGVGFGTFVIKPSPFGKYQNQLNSLGMHRMRYHKEAVGQQFKNEFTYVGNEGTDVEVVDDMQSLNAVFADYIHAKGVGYYMERDELVKKMAKEQAKAQPIEEELSHPAESDEYDDDDFEPEVDM